MNEKTLDTYLDLCTEVYDLSKPNPPKDAYDFYRSYVIKAKGPILEPMCGTGRFLLPLLEESFDVEGFDASDHMLKTLQAKAKIKGLKPKVRKGFAESSTDSKKYNLIFIPSGSFGLIADNNVAKAALKNFYNQLNNNGIFLFEIETLKALPDLNVWRGSAWQRTDGKKIIVSSLAILEEENLCRSIAKYELVDNNNIIRTEIEEYKIRLYDPKFISDMLHEIGFKNIRMVKAFDSLSTAALNDEVIVFECRK